MRKITALALVTAGAAVTATGFASPAFAATWTVSGNTNADGSYSASAGTTTLKDGNTTLTCTSATAGGVLQNGAYATGDNIGSITSATFTSCSGPLGLRFTVSQNAPWTINAVQPDATAGVTDGTITGVDATLSGPGCAANVTGGVPGTYTNGTGVLAASPTAPNPNAVQLTISGVSGCFGLIRNGDHPTFTASYSVSPSSIAISTP